MVLPAPSSGSFSCRPAQMAKALLQRLFAQQKPTSLHTDLSHRLPSSFPLQSLRAGLVHTAGGQPAPARRCPGTVGRGSPKAIFSPCPEPRVWLQQGRNATSLTQERTHQHRAQAQFGWGKTKFSSNCAARNPRKFRIDPVKVPNWHNFL